MKRDDYIRKISVHGREVRIADITATAGERNGGHRPFAVFHPHPG